MAKVDWQNNILQSQERHLILLEKGMFADVTFAVCKKDFEKEPKILAAHKLILAGASSVFEAMFYGPLAHKTEAAIKVDDIDSNTFSMMLKFIYSNKFNLESWDLAAKLYEAAKKYLLNAIANYCIEYLQKCLNANNALKIYEFAKFSDKNLLMKSAFEIIKKETLSVITSPDFLEIDESTILMILAEKELGASEMELYNAIEAAASAQNGRDEKKDQATQKAKKSKKEDHLKFRAAVKKINFLAMTAKEFSSGPANSNLLLPDESLAIIRCLLDPQKNINSYPKGFVQGIRRKKLLPRVCLNLLLLPIVIQLDTEDVPCYFDRLLISCKNNRFLEITASHPIVISVNDSLFPNEQVYKVNGMTFCPMSMSSYNTSKLYNGTDNLNAVEYQEDLCIFIIGDRVVLGQIVEGANRVTSWSNDFFISPVHHYVIYAIRNIKIGDHNCCTVTCDVSVKE